MTKTRPTSEAWAWRHGLTRSGLPPTTRHVLLTLSMYMDEAGGSCFPTVDHLAEATGLTKKTVITNLQKAVGSGWLRKQLHGYRGQRWRQLEYEARWPDRETDDPAAVGKYEEPADKGGEPRTPPSNVKLEKEVREAGVCRTPKLVNEIHRDKDQSTRPVQYQSSDEKVARARKEDQERITPSRLRQADNDPEGGLREALSQIFDAWTRQAKGGAGAIGNTERAIQAIAELSAQDRKAAVERAPRYLFSLKAAKRDYTPSVETYIRNREFDHHPAPPVGKKGDTPVEIQPYSTEAWVLLWRAVSAATEDERPKTGNTDWFSFFLQGLGTGFTMPARAVPSSQDIMNYWRVEKGSAMHKAWSDYCRRIGFSLPDPTTIRVVIVPREYPPEINTPDYKLVRNVQIVPRSKTWWWRLHKRLERGEPLVTTFGSAHFDPIERARDKQGYWEESTGPLPLPTELDAMIEIRKQTPQWDAWGQWFAAKGSSLDHWPETSIWCLGQYPQ